MHVFAGQTAPARLVGQLVSIMEGVGGTTRQFYGRPFRPEIAFMTLLASLMEGVNKER
jgi:hypothetical protein